jgi:hypothetical protein
MGIEYTIETEDLDDAIEMYESLGYPSSFINRLRQHRQHDTPFTVSQTQSNTRSTRIIEPRDAILGAMVGVAFCVVCVALYRRIVNIGE